MKTRISRRDGRIVAAFLLVTLLISGAVHAQAPVTLSWTQPAPNTTVSGTVQLRLTGQAFRNVEIFRSGQMIARAVVSSDMTSAIAAIDTRQFANGAVTLTAHAWNSTPGMPFTSDADAGPLALSVSNVSVQWAQPAANSTVSGTVQFRLTGQAFRNVEIFRNGQKIARAAVSADLRTATAVIDTRQFVDGPLALTAHAWNSLPGAAFTSDADAGTLNLIVNSAPSPGNVWSPLSHLTVVDPTDHGAIANDGGDDIAGLEASVAALPATGGIVLFPAGTFLKHRVWTIDKHHVLLWAPNRRATLHATVAPQTQQCMRQQALIFRYTTGGGVSGLRVTSDAAARGSCAEDNVLVFDSVDAGEAFGMEIAGSNGTGIFAWSSRGDDEPARKLLIKGNYIHHTYADAIHQTAGTRETHVWGNWIFNEAPSRGDDGIACVTYDRSPNRCGQMEWWDNRYVGGAFGRGLAVIGGDHILIHHNWVVRSAAAGILVASELGYDSASSEHIGIQTNWIVQSPNGLVPIGHSSLLVSGGNPAAEPIREVRALGNVIIDAPSGRVQRAEGLYDPATVVFNNSTDTALLPGPVPTPADARPRDTSILRTHDTSFAPAVMRKGLYRIHVRESAGGLQERFEYVVRGPAAAMGDWLNAIGSQGAYVSESRDVAGTIYALILAPTPLAVPTALSAVSFDELRAGDRNSTLRWLWFRLDQAQY